MRPVTIFAQSSDADSLLEALREIERASHEADTGEISDAYTIVNAPDPPVRSLDASTATLADVRNFLATLLVDLQRRGTNRGS